MNYITFVYLFYMFVALYMTSLFVLLYVRNRKKLFDYPKTNKEYSISAIIPAYNEEKGIKSTVESVLRTNYSGLKEIIVVNDGSSDKTKEIVEELERKHEKVKLLNKKNEGSKASAINFGLKIAKSELVAVIDADSHPKEDAMEKMVGFFDNKKTGVVTSAIFVQRRKRYIEKLQAIEYNVIAWTRKLLEFVDSVYVTPGPLSIYRKDVLEEVGGFDPKSMTEDIEITWRLAYYGYNRMISLPARVYTVAPDNLRQWFKQRIRWNMGGFQAIGKYKHTFMKRGILGMFIVPYFTISLFLGVGGLVFLGYLFTRRFVITKLIAEYRVLSGSSLVAIEDLSITPNIVNFFGFTLFFFALLYTLFALKIMKEDPLLRKEKLLYMPLYLILYLTLYPFIIPIAGYKLLAKDTKWGTK